MRTFLVALLLAQNPSAPPVTTWPPHVCFQGTVTAPGGEPLPAPVACPNVVPVASLPQFTLYIPLSDGVNAIPVQVAGPAPIPALAGNPFGDGTPVYAFRIQPFNGVNVPIWEFFH